VFDAGGSIAFNNTVAIAGTLVATAGINTAIGGISVNAPITSAAPDTTYGINLVSTGPITESAGGSIATPALRAVTQNDTGAAITLNNTGNVTEIITLSALNTAGTALAPGPISFTNSGPLAIDNVSGNGIGGLELGISTASTASLASTGSITEFNTGVRVAAQNLIVRTQLDAGAPINLNNPGNAVPGNVTLSALNTAGTAAAAGTNGTVTFFDNTGFTIASAGAPQLGVVTSTGAGTTATLQAGGALAQTGVIDAPSLVARTQLDAGAPINLNNAGNAVPGNVTLSALNTAGTAAPAGTAGTITFFDSAGFTIASAGAPQLGVVTSTGAGTTATLQAGGALAQAGIGETALASIVAPDLVARTEFTGGAPIILNSMTNVVSNVTLTSLNTAAAATDAGAISFIDNGNFTVVGQPASGVAGKEIGVDTRSTIVLAANLAGALLTNAGAIDSTGAGATTGSDILLLADTMTLTAGTINAGTVGRVVLGPYNPGQPSTLVGVGGTPGVGQLNISNADLATITTPQLQIGGTGTGYSSTTITVSGTITANPATKTLVLVSRDDITDTVGGVVQPESIGDANLVNLALSSTSGSVHLKGANAVTTVAGNAGGSFAFADAPPGGPGTLVVGVAPPTQPVVAVTLAGGVPTISNATQITGIAMTTGSVSLKISGNLTINDAISANAGVAIDESAAR
jgi:hypothetical protein